MATTKKTVRKTKKRRIPAPVVDEVSEDEEDTTEGQDGTLELYRVVPEKPRVKALLYSEPGAGKTTLAASAQAHPELAPVVFANIEGGMLSIAGRRDIHAVDIRSTEELYNLYRMIKNGTGPFGEVGTLVLDNITELQTLNLDEIVTAEVSAGKNSNRISTDDIWQEDYGTSTVQLSRLFRWFKGLDINFIMTAHAKFVYPPSGGRKQSGAPPDVEPLAVLPMLTQKLMKTVMGMVDFCWFLQYDAATNKRHMLTRPDGIYAAKTRGPRFARAMGPVVTNPKMGELYDLLVKSEGVRSR